MAVSRRGGDSRDSTARQAPYRWRSLPARTRHYAQGPRQRMQVLRIAAWIAVCVNVIFGSLQFFVGPDSAWIAGVNLVSATVFLLTPQLYRFGELAAPVTFTIVAYATTFLVCRAVGTDSGLQFYFLVGASVSVLVIGLEHLALVIAVIIVGVVLAIVLQFTVPGDTGAQDPWVLDISFVTVLISACFLIFATLWYALRETRRAEAAMEAEYERSEALLVNILPASIARRLKDPATEIIADSYDEASVLFADIADFTKRASQTDPPKLVDFLNRLYTDLDHLVDRRGLEKIKTSGDAYMVVSGVPNRRSNHLQALARLALDITEVVSGIRDPLGQPVSLRIGLATGPVVAGVVGTRRFFYDVWGDAVNLASRMESTAEEGRIQVPDDVHERLADAFVFAERGDVDVKGKGVMRTWYLLGERSESHSPERGREPAPTRLPPQVRVRTTR